MMDSNFFSQGVLSKSLKRETMIQIFEINSSTIIQAGIRGYFARRKRRELTRQKSCLMSASKIQRWWKKQQKSKFKILLDRTSPTNGQYQDLSNLDYFRGGDLERFSNANIIIEAIMDLTPKK